MLLAMATTPALSTYNTKCVPWARTVGRGKAQSNEQENKKCGEGKSMEREANASMVKTEIDKIKLPGQQSCARSGPWL